MLPLTATTQIEPGATVQRTDDAETRKVLDVVRGEDGLISRVVLANRSGLFGEPDTLTTDGDSWWEYSVDEDTNQWVVL